MKIFKCLYIYILFVNSSVFAQDNAEAIVKQSLEAYNARDIDGFMALFDDNIEMYNFHEEKIRAKGIDDVRTLYKSFFDASPELHSKILKRIVLGNTVIDHEYITGARGKKEAYELVFIYEVKDGKIFRTTSIKQ